MLQREAMPLLALAQDRDEATLLTDRVEVAGGEEETEAEPPPDHHQVLVPIATPTKPPTLQHPAMFQQTLPLRS